MILTLLDARGTLLRLIRTAGREPDDEGAPRGGRLCRPRRSAFSGCFSRVPPRRRRLSRRRPPWNRTSVAAGPTPGISPGGWASPTTRPIPSRNSCDFRTGCDSRPRKPHAKSHGCIHCHTDVGNMHPEGSVHIGCTDCHGGRADCAEMSRWHTSRRRYPEAWRGSGNPVRSYTLLNHESPEFIRFVNPGDLRIAHIACGQCHANEVLQVRKSMMTHGCMLWGAALYNNGAVPRQVGRLRRKLQHARHTAASANGTAAHRGRNSDAWHPPVPRPTARRSRSASRATCCESLNGVAGFVPKAAIPERLEEPGRPRERLSNRGLGTENRTDPVFIGLQKTRLLDPTLNFLGTNDHPGDYRSSGCSACHVLYANDRDPVSSAFLARYGNEGHAAEHTDDWVQAVDPDDPQARAGASDPAQVRIADAQQPVHRLPCPSGHERAEQLLGIHVVGQRNRRRMDVSASAEGANGRRIHRARR